MRDQSIAVFPNFLPWRNPSNNSSHPEEPLVTKMFTGQMQLVAHTDYPILLITGQKIPAMFRGMFGIFLGISKFVGTYSTISGGTSNDVPRNPGWETLLQSDVSTTDKRHKNAYQLMPREIFWSVTK